MVASQPAGSLGIAIAIAIEMGSSHHELLSDTTVQSVPNQGQCLGYRLIFDMDRSSVTHTRCPVQPDSTLSSFVKVNSALSPSAGVASWYLVIVW